MPLDSVQNKNSYSLPSESDRCPTSLILTRALDSPPRRACVAAGLRLAPSLPRLRWPSPPRRTSVLRLASRHRSPSLSPSFPAPARAPRRALRQRVIWVSRIALELDFRDSKLRLKRPRQAPARTGGPRQPADARSVPAARQSSELYASKSCTSDSLQLFDETSQRMESSSWVC